MKNLTLHIPRHFPYKIKLMEFINNNNLTIRHLHERFSSLSIYGDNDDINKLIEFVKEFSDYKVYPIIDSISKDSHYNIGDTNTRSFTSKDISYIYGININNNDRVNIALIELEGGYRNSDLQTYWNYMDLKIKPNVVSISVDNTVNNPNDKLNVTSDIQILGGICSNSNIYVYFTPNTDTGLYNGVYNAIYNNAYPVNIIVITCGANEKSYDTNTINALNDLFAQAAQRNITICTSIGNGNIVNFPSSSPWVLACGGTKLLCNNKTYNHTTIETGLQENITEHDNFSSIFDAPTYQLPILIKYKPEQISFKRGLPDVSGMADLETGWKVYVNDEFRTIGGTGAVACMWGAYLASINYAKFLNPNLYNNYQINKNILNTIGLFWNNNTGLGSPNGTNLTIILNPNYKELSKEHSLLSGTNTNTCCTTL